MNTEKLSKRIDDLVILGKEALKTERSVNDRMGRTKKFLDLEEFYKFRSASISFILKLFGENHPYLTDFSKVVESAQPSCANRGIGILKAIKNEIEGGWLNTTRGIISAEIFSDFMEMAEHLLEEGYKDPAAVLVGSALEQHLKTLANNNGVETTFERGGKYVPKKADVLNADLVKSGVYSKLDQKSITYWLDIRNQAAHGNFEAYNEDQVKFLLTSVAEFIGRISK